MQPVCRAVSEKALDACIVQEHQGLIQVRMLQDGCCCVITRIAIFGWYPARFSSLTTCSIAVHALGSNSAR